MTHLTDEIAKERLLREMAKHGLVEPGEKIRWRLTAKGDLWGGALYGIRRVMDHRGEEQRPNYVH
jgi:hypothetical protein